MINFFRKLAIATAAVATFGGLATVSASASTTQPTVSPNVVGQPIKEASGSFCLRDNSGGNPGASARVVEGNCGPGPGENLAFETTGGTFEGFPTGEFHFTGELTPEVCLGVRTSDWAVAIPQFCSGADGVVFIKKPKNGAFLIVSRPGTQALNSDLMLTGANSANVAFSFGTASAGFQRFVNN